MEDEKKEVPEEEAPQPQPGDFPIDIQELMADYEGQIAAKSREAMMARMQTKAVQRELDSIKEALLQVQGAASGLRDKPKAKKAAPKRR